MRPPHRRGEVYNFNGRIHPTHAPPHYHQTNISVLLRLTQLPLDGWMPVSKPHLSCWISSPLLTKGEDRGGGLLHSYQT